MPNQCLLFLEILECVLTYVQLLFESKRLRVWRVIPCINVIPSQLNNLQALQQLLIAADTHQNGNGSNDGHTIIHLYVFDFGLLLMLLLQVLIKGRQFFDVLQNS